MSAKPVQQRAPWILTALLLSQVVLMSALARRPDREQSMLGVWVMGALTPVASFFSKSTGWAKGLIGSYADVRHAREENIQLRAELDKMGEELNAARERAAELVELKTDLALPPMVQYRQIAANVIARDTSVWFRQMTIDRGTTDGIKRDMPVMATGGVVGRVKSVGPNFAVVQLITDKQAGLGAMLQNSRAKGEIKGIDNGRCELRSISTTENVEEGEALVTTGLDRIYPRGLLVGTVERLENDPNAPWHRIIVKPAAPVDRVEHGLVLLVEQKDLKVDEGK